MHSDARIIFDQDVSVRPGLLEEKWSQSPTFALVAQKSGVACEWIEEKLAKLPDCYAENHFALLTSGSTGHPKLVVGRRDRAKALAKTLHSLQDSEPVQETIVTLPLSYSYAFVNQWLWAFYHQRKLVITSGLAQPDQLNEALSNTRSAMLCLVGAQVPLLMKYFDQHSFPNVIRVHFAGGRFPQERLDWLKRAFPNAAIFNNYGCAEAMPRLTLRRAEASALAYDIGRTLPGVELKADSESRLLFRSEYGAVALVDESGLVHIDQNTWVPTGDLGCQNESGHWEIQGRVGDVFKRYGEKISVLQILAEVRACWHGQADFYRENDTQGEMGYVLLLSPEPVAEELRTILKQISLSRPRPHWPLRLESLPAMPLLTNGKIDRLALLSQPERQIHWKQHI